MNNEWQAFLEKNGARCENGLISDFGHPAEELVAARDATVIAPLAHLALFECAGEDAKSFLHNQLTSDVNHLETASAQHSAWCSAKGRMLASFVLYRRENAYRALLYADLLAETLKRLQIYVLRSKVKLLPLSGDHVLIGLSGAKAVAALEAVGLTPPANPLETTEFSGGTLIRLDARRFILTVESAQAAACWQALCSSPASPVPVGTAAWQWLDIQAGTPWISAATREEFVPQMVNFDKIGGVSFRKGCYPGQEVVARAHHLGRVKRHLYRLHVDGPITAGQSLTAPGNAELAGGKIVNAAPSPAGGYDALAVIKEDFVDNGTALVELPGVRILSLVSLGD